jgi:hypothetical protein
MARTSGSMAWACAEVKSGNASPGLPSERL